MELYAYPGRLSTPSLISANATLSIASQWVRFGVGGLAIGVPTPVGNTGRIIVLEKMSGDYDAITFTPAAGNIAGAATTAIHTPGETLHLISDGADWVKVNRYIPARQSGYKATFSNFGTVTPGNQSFQSWRVGKYLNIKGEFTAGTPAAGGASFTIGFNGTNAPAAVIVDATFYAASLLVGKFTSGTANNTTGNVYVTPGDSQLKLSGYFINDAFNQANANNICNVGGTVRFEAYNIPIAGWLD